MLLFRKYDKEKRLDRAWFKSSNVLYSECVDVPNELKILRVTFNNGATYEYSEVDVNDYVMFLKGGLDGSHGKALNQFIKKRNCPYKKLDSLSVTELQNEMEKLLKEEQEKKMTEEKTEVKTDTTNKEEEA